MPISSILSNFIPAFSKPAPAPAPAPASTPKLQIKRQGQASDIEEVIMRQFWTHEPSRAEVGLCPNCLAQRIGGLAKPHATWCAIKRRVKKEEQKASDYLIQI